MKLSILIPSLINRADMLRKLLDELHKQIGDLPIEIKCIIDNKKQTTGAKRNDLLSIAKGEYIVFIDDDDEIYPNYVSLIYLAIQQGTDCIATKGHFSQDGGHLTEWRLSKDFGDHDSNGILYRRANHLTPVKRYLALQAMFPDKSNAEDKEYSERLNKHLHTEWAIEEPIYHYKYLTSNKEYV